MSISSEIWYNKLLRGKFMMWHMNLHKLNNFYLIKKLKNFKIWICLFSKLLNKNQFDKILCDFICKFIVTINFFIIHRGIKFKLSNNIIIPNPSNIKLINNLKHLHYFMINECIWECSKFMKKKYICDDISTDVGLFYFKLFFYI